MRIITLEEHYRSKLSPEFTTPYYDRFNFGAGQLAEKLADIGERRIAEMDSAGISMQILSHTAPSPEILDGQRALPLCQKINDELAAAVAAHPTRFGAFASLPIGDPVAAATELERAIVGLEFQGAMIHGCTQGRFLDDAFFYPILEKAEALEVPIYLHPAPPPEPVFDVYFAGLDKTIATMLATAGWGWHAELGLHTLRLIAAGIFDRFPKLQIIIGHMGEMIPFQLARVDRGFSRFSDLKRKASEYFQSNLHITTSGLFTAPPLNLALQTLGADRILFSIDYPYSSLETGKTYLDQLFLPAADLEKIAHRNAERLFKFNSATA